MFEGKTAVITGGASGIGRALAEAFGGRGARVMVADLDEAALSAAVAELRAAGVDADAQVTDVTDADAVERLAEHSWDRFGGVDIICNNAGVATYGPLAEAPRQDWEYALSVNLWGVVHGISSFVPRLIRQGRGGHVVNTASMSGLIGMEYLGVYCASKFAVVGLSEALQRELRPHEIGVTLVCPMVVDTPINENSLRMRPEDLRVQGAPPEAGELVGGVVPPEAVADRVVEAVEDGSLYVLTHPEQRAILARRAARLDEAAARVTP